MNTNELFSNLIDSNPGSALCRSGKSNFVAIPGEIVDGVQTYLKVSVTTALYKDTKTHAAFDFDSAKAEYEAWAVAQAEKPEKTATAKVPNLEAQARREALDAAIEGLDAFEKLTATDILAALPDGLAPNVMAVGSAAKRLVEKGVLTMDIVEKKKYYSKA